MRPGNTLEEQMSRSYYIGIYEKQRATQYQVTLPSLIAAPWVEKWGRHVRFVPTEDGILIQPAPHKTSDLPDWMT